MLTNCKNGVSSYEIARDVKVTQKSAWFMLQRIRLAMQDDFFGSKLGGEVEVDETFIGGKARNMHVSERKRRITGTGTKDKTAVMGILERGGKVRAAVVPSRRKTVLQDEVRNTSPLARRSTAMRSCPTTDWQRITLIKSLTMRLST
jgi:hypothetical protein